MAVRFLLSEVSDLCLGKPPLKSLSVAATVAESISFLKVSGEFQISVWNCDHSTAAGDDADCRCVGKISMVDIIYFLCKNQNLQSPSAALKSPLSVLLAAAAPNIVIHVEPNYRLLDAIDLMVQGAQNLVVPIPRSNLRRKQMHKSSTNSTLHRGHHHDFCWLTQEDIIRSLLSSINLFSPFPSLSLASLNLVHPNFPAVDFNSSATSALDLLLNSHTSVAVIDTLTGTLIGEISPLTLSSFNESIAFAVSVLSAGELVSYIDHGGAFEDILDTVKGFRGPNPKEVPEEFGGSEIGSQISSSSSDDEKLSSLWMGSYGRRRSRMVRGRAETILCQTGSSLVAVMVQAITCRVNYVWVVEGDGGIAGMVSFWDILKVFRQNFEGQLFS